jgi:hypothetical protein
VTIAWNPPGFDLLRAGPNGKTFNAEYYRVNIIPELVPPRPPSDRFLFEHIRHRLRGIAFPSREELLIAIHEIIGTIPRPTLEDLFRHWMERLEWISQNNGAHSP